MQGMETRPPVPERRLPRSLRFDEPHRRGILLDHRPNHTPLTAWCRGVLPKQPRVLIQITRALVDNAHRHSRSGRPGGTVRIELDQTRPLLPHLYVTDNGPLNGDDVAYPCLDKRTPGSGLALVERLALYWDFSWEWDGQSIGDLTVHVVLDLTDR
jgi:serine/threonine-protein kinase RsbW